MEAESIEVDWVAGGCSAGTGVLWIRLGKLSLRGTGRPRFHRQVEEGEVVGVERNGVVCIALSIREYCVWRSTEKKAWVGGSWQTRRGASDALSREARRLKSITLHGSAPNRHRQEEMVATGASRLCGRGRLLPVVAQAVVG